MENNNMVLSDQKVGREYQIPELVDLNCISEAFGVCDNGSSPGGNGTCVSGPLNNP